MDMKIEEIYDTMDKKILEQKKKEVYNKLSRFEVIQNDIIRAFKEDGCNDNGTIIIIEFEEEWIEEFFSPGYYTPPLSSYCEYYVRKDGLKKFLKKIEELKKEIKRLDNEIEKII